MVKLTGLWLGGNSMNVCRDAPVGSLYVTKTLVMAATSARGTAWLAAARSPREAGRVAIAPYGHRATSADEIEFAGLRSEEGGNPIAPASR